jgi:protein-disulfide isomerase
MSELSNLPNEQHPPVYTNKFYYGIMACIIAGCLLIAGSIMFGAHYLASKVPASADPNRIYDIKLADNTPFLGNADAKVVMVEYADFQCPFCRDFHNTIFPQLKSKFIDTGKIKFVFLNFAFLGDESTRAVEAAKCSADQGKFWEYHNMLYDNQKAENSGGFSDDNLKKFAETLKLDAPSFASCLSSGTKKSEVEKETSTASQEYGVNSTPTIFINGKKLNGLRTVSDYQTAIEAASKGK